METRFHTYIGIAALLALFVSLPTEGRANEPNRHWMMGWDDGPSVRYLPTPNWGFGIRYDPNAYSYSNSWGGDWEQSINGDAGIIVFYQNKLGRRLFLGPFLEYRYGEKWDEGKKFQNGLAIGIRPALRVIDRILVESRFGLGLVYRRGEDFSNGGVGPFSERLRRWELMPIGGEVGIKGSIQFMFMF